jgi:S-adenosylmethionine synthetase
VKIKIPYLRPDAKSQVTLEYSDDNNLQCRFVISTQHDDFDEECLLKLKDIVSILIPRIIAKYPAHAPLFNAIKYHINQLVNL